MRLRTFAIILPVLTGACATAPVYEPPRPVLLPPPPPAPVQPVRPPPPETLSSVLADLPKQNSARVATQAMYEGLIEPRREWFKGISYQPPYHPHHAYLVYIPEGLSSNFEFRPGEKPSDNAAFCDDGGTLMDAAWTKFGSGPSERWVLRIKVMIRTPEQLRWGCTITTDRGIYHAVIHMAETTHTRVIAWSDPYDFLAEAKVEEAPICEGVDTYYSLAGDPGAFGIQVGDVSNDGRHTCIRFPPTANFDLPSAWLIEGGHERPASPSMINGAYVIDGVPPVIELRTDAATLRIERTLR